MSDQLCQLNEGPMFQCCCNCQHHIPDHHHCTRDRDLRKEKGGCICSIQKGWICAGFVSEDWPNGVAYSNWPEHSVGCELYSPRQQSNEQ